jgi:hypothetical protein
MQIYHNPKTVFPCPLEGAQNVGPTGAGQERFARPYFNSPPGDGQSDPIKSRARDFSEIYFGLGGQKRGGVRRRSGHVTRGAQE